MTQLDFSSYLAERTRDFTGRAWLFTTLDSWLADPSAPRIFILTGEPGIGKTAIAAQLVRLSQSNKHPPGSYMCVRPGFVSAYHFCVARQVETTDPLSFARSIASQLAQIDGFAQELLAQHGNSVDVRIEVQRNYGQIEGIHAENLFIGAASATEAFQAMVVSPLLRLYAEGFDQRLLVLVDALDEAAQHIGPENILDLLANTRGLPAQVRFVLTCRPEDAVLRHFDDRSIPYLRLDARSPENQADLHSYVSQRLDGDVSLQMRLREQQMSRAEFVDQIMRASQGNFLYVIWLLPAIASGAQSFGTLSALPEGLAGIYGDFLRTRLVGRDINLWRERYRPLLAFLTAAQAPLTAADLEHFTGLDTQTVYDLLRDLRQFLDPSLMSEDRYRLYHQSVADFLSSKSAAEEFWIDLAPVHRQVVEACRGGASNWDTANLAQVRDYEKRYLAAHLYALRGTGSYSADLSALVETQAWTATKYIDTPWVDSLIEDYQLASAVAWDGSVDDWVRGMGYQLRRALIEWLMSGVSERRALFLVRLGQADQALSYARRQRYTRYDLMRGIAGLVAPSRPAEAVRILTEMALSLEDRDVRNRCVARLAAAQDILRLTPEYRHAALDLVEEARGLAPAIPSHDVAEYQTMWDLPTLALSGELSVALTKAQGLLPIQQARALRQIALALPPDHPEKQGLLEQALSLLEALERGAEVASEKMKSIVALVPLVSMGARSKWLDLLESTGDYLRSSEASLEQRATVGWAIGRVAQTDLNWSKRMVLQSEQGSMPDVLCEVVREIARVDYMEALQLVRQRLSNHIATPHLLADIIEIVATDDVSKAEALIEEYSEELRDAKDDARIAIGEAYLARGNARKAQEILDALPAMPRGEGVVHARENLRLAILARSGFLPAAVARDRLMQFPACPHCHRSREEEAKRLLVRIAVDQERLDVLGWHGLGREARLAAAYRMADHGDPGAARKYLEGQRVSLEWGKGARAVDAHIAAAEASKDPVKLEMLMEHYRGDASAHHFCFYMRELPSALQRLIETGRIDRTYARSIIDELYSQLVAWQCPGRDELDERDLWGGPCECYAHRDDALARLIGIMARLDLQRSEDMAASLPAQPLRVEAMRLIMHQIGVSEGVANRIVIACEECIDEPGQRARAYYLLARDLPANMSEMIKHLVSLAEPLLRQASIDHRVSGTELKILKGQVLMKLVDGVGQFPYMIESLRAIEGLVRLEDRLGVLDYLTRQAMTWSAEDQLSALWRIHEFVSSRELTDVHAFIAVSIPLVHTLGGEEAFWRLQHYVEWAYEGLPSSV